MTQQTIPSGGLQGSAVLVTGGGTGIGTACAVRLAADGAAVTISGRTESSLAAAVATISAAAEAAGNGGSAQYVAGDVTKEDDVARMVAKAVEPTGALDGVVANAGGSRGMSPYHLTQTEQFVETLHLNVVGTMLCIKHSVPHLVAAGGGSFVGMSSIAGYVTHPYFGAYTVSKAGIEQMMRNAADEYGAVNVRFNAIRPGFIATEIMEGIPRDSPVYDSYITQTPMGDVGQPEDVAALARFLIGPDSRWITGTAIAVDGGHGLRRGPDFGPFLEPFLGADVMLAKKPFGAE
ncbi:MAG: Short-chain dehydrogenase [Ilumatobacteraceae bacterium]|nr:Short-chain dehydrogenase [Ilumatobacteraceae bacterium]